MKIFAKDNIFVVPKNDLESVEIAKLLRENGWRDGVDLFITNQPWGASWQGLEPEIKEALREHSARVRVEVARHGPGVPSCSEPVLDKITMTLKKAAEYIQVDSLDTVKHAGRFGKFMVGAPVPMPPDFSSVYGVELKGHTFCYNIDHHNYCDRDWETGAVLYQDDRTKNIDGSPKLSSLEQVAELIGVELTLDQKFIAANDKGFVEGMREYGEEIFMSPEEISQRIVDIRMREHAILAEVQGITPEMEKQAEKAIQEAQLTENGTLCVRLPHSRCATVTDRIPEQEYNGGLLIVCGNGKDEKEVDYYGPTSVVQKLSEHLGGWTGDTSQTHTFWGTSDWPNQRLLMDIVNGKDLSQEIVQGELELPTLDL